MYYNRTRALDMEKKRTDLLLYQMLPQPVADLLRKNAEVNAETFAEVTVFFSDIVGFTAICAKSSPIQVRDRGCEGLVRDRGCEG